MSTVNPSFTVDPTTAATKSTSASFPFTVTSDTEGAFATPVDSVQPMLAAARVPFA